jgi:hypothetical protein
MKATLMIPRWFFGLFLVGVFASAALADDPPGGAAAKDTPAAGSIRAPADQRFSQDTDEVPSFRQHVVPLLGRLGCNGRACHGSFQGQGGFRLSLFGYDFEADHKALVEGENPRSNPQDPANSLILQKPTLQVDHGGEQRFKIGGWEYRLLHKWIASGAKGYADSEPEFVHIEVTPKEFLFTQPGEKFQLKVVGTWSDGSREDVTPISRFRTNDESVANVDESGLVTCTGKGDTHIVAFYDNGVLPVQVILPVSDKVGDNYPQVAASTKLDELVLIKLRKLGIVPSEICSDQAFLRRLSLDLTGTLPTAEEVRAFLADPSSDKRSKKLEELLQRPGYAAWWTTRLCDWTGANPNVSGENAFRSEQYQQWYQWMYRRVAENTPYDKLVKGIVLANSRKEGQSFEEYCAEMTSYVRSEERADFAARESMPHFWSRIIVRQPKDKALAFAYSFLGVRLQCAECHKHPFDQWTKQDFDQFTAFFNGVSYGTRREDNEAFRKMQQELTDGMTGGQANRQLGELARQGKTVPWREVYFDTRRVAGEQRARQNNQRRNNPAARVITPKLLGGEEVLAEQYPDARAALMEWMRDQANPYFARSFVNRVWANYFHVGIVEPPDDMNLANPPSNAELLDYLTRGFVESGYDMKWLHRQIVLSDTYQRTWRPNDTNVNDQRNFSRAVPRRLPAEVAYDALLMASASTSKARDLLSDMSQRAIGDSTNTRNRQGGSYALTVFGRPERATNCDCERSNEPSLLQTIFLRNDNDVLSMLDRNDGWVAEVTRAARNERPRQQADEQRISRDDLKAALAKGQRALERAREEKNDEQIRVIERRLAAIRRQLESTTDEPQPEEESKPAPQAVGPQSDQAALVQEAFLKTLSRFPTDDEQRRAEQYLADSADKATGLRDLLWALVNTKEFIVNH